MHTLHALPHHTAHSPHTPLTVPVPPPVPWLPVEENPGLAGQGRGVAARRKTFPTHQYLGWLGFHPWNVLIFEQTAWAAFIVHSFIPRLPCSSLNLHRFLRQQDPRLEKGSGYRPDMTKNTLEPLLGQEGTGHKSCCLGNHSPSGEGLKVAFEEGSPVSAEVWVMA